jgi:kynurenine formamidase
MEAVISHQGKKYAVELDRPLDISMPIADSPNKVNCFFAPPVEFSPVRMGGFVGSTAEGGVVNFFNVKINPHGNGTHTECVGHIALERFTINQCLKVFHYMAKLVSVFPERAENGDRVIRREQVEELLSAGEADAIVLRTLPNDDLKLRTQYSGSNPPYLHHEAVAYLVDCGVKHLLIDLPSVDREEDGGRLQAHRSFWQYPAATRIDCTITELIYVPPAIRDGLYLLNLQIGSFELDVSPSKPVLYRIIEF